MRSLDQVAGQQASIPSQGRRSKLRFKALNAGLYFYHCATASPSIPEHIANGMYGGILVEPVGGLKKVDKEFYVVQSEFYTKPGKKGVYLGVFVRKRFSGEPLHMWCLMAWRARLSRLL